MKRILCQAFVDAERVTLNCVVCYDECSMTFISANEFNGETPSTSHFDGVAVNGDISIDFSAIAAMISKDDFRASLEKLRRWITPSSRLLMVRI